MVNAGVVGLASTAGVGLVITADTLGMNVNPVPHGGSSEVLMSALRGDIDWLQYPFDFLMPYIKNNEVIPLLIFSTERNPELPDVPTVAELGYPELAEIVQLHRVMGISPDVPENIVQILRDAFQQTVKDPDFQKDLKTAGYTPTPLSGEETAAVVAQHLEQFAKYKDLILQYR